MENTATSEQQPETAEKSVNYLCGGARLVAQQQNADSSARSMRAGQRY
jgi:hypothetical protein